MAVTHLLKQVIEALPGDSFTKAWKCIEEIDAALNKAGPTALLAMKYCQEQHEERVAQLLDSQQTRITHLSEVARGKEEYAEETLKENDALHLDLEKAERKIDRLKKKNSKK